MLLCKLPKILAREKEKNPSRGLRNKLLFAYFLWWPASSLLGADEILSGQDIAKLLSITSYSNPHT